MRARNVRIVMPVLGGVAGVLGGLLIAASVTAFREVQPKTQRSQVADRAVGTLSGDASPTEVAEHSEKADAAKRIIDAHLRENHCAKAFEILDSIDLVNHDRDYVLMHIADATFPEFAPKTEEAKDYVARNGGESRVVAMLPVLYAVERKLNSPALRVKLLLRMKNLYDLLGDKAVAGIAQPVAASAARPDDNASVLRPIPAQLRPLEEATQITKRMSTEARTSVSPQSFGVILAALGGAFGVTLIAILQGIASAVGSRMTQGVIENNPDVIEALSRVFVRISERTDDDSVGTSKTPSSPAPTNGVRVA